MKYTGLIALLAAWIGIAASSVIAGLDVFGELPFSHLNTLDDTKNIFRAGILISAALSVVYLFWIHREYKVTKLFAISWLLGLCGQVIAAFIPYESFSDVNLWHQSFAIILYISYLVMTAELYRDQPNTTVGKFSKVTFVVYLIALIVGAYVYTVFDIKPAAQLVILLPGSWFVAIGLYKPFYVKNSY